MNKKGFTLIELMLSMFIGALVFGGVFTTFKNQKLLYSRQEKIIKINQDTRAALDIMKRYIKKAGISVSGCSSTDSNRICTGVENIGANFFTVTSDLDLSGTINNSIPRIASDMEEVTFIKGGDNTLYICAGAVTSSPETNDKCEFILDNVDIFSVKGCYTDSSTGAVNCTNNSSDKDKFDSILLDLQAETKKSDLTEGAKIKGDKITMKVFFVNKIFQ